MWVDENYNIFEIVLLPNRYCNTKSNMNRSAKLFFKERVMLKPEQTGLPEIPVIGRLNYAAAHPPLSRHDHQGCIEICYLSKGRQTYQVAGRSYHLSGGDLFLTFPNEKHSSGMQPEEKSILYWVIVRLDNGKAPFLGLVPEQARQLKKSLLSIKYRHFKGGPTIRNTLDGIIQAVYSKNSEMRDIALRNKLVEFLLQVIYYGQKKNGAQERHALSSIVEFIHENLEEKISLISLAQRAGLSVSRFKAKFKKLLGVPPAEYIARKKIERARELLSQGGRSVTDVAFALDFSSSQYFATVFKRYTGKSPGALLLSGKEKK